MSDIFEPAVDSSTKTVSASGAPAKEKLLAQVREEPAKAFSIIVAGTVLVSVIVGFCIFRMEEASRRQRLLEACMREVTNWISQHGQRIAAPIKGGFEATKSAVEEVSHSGTHFGRQLNPFLRKQKRTFLNLF